MKTILFACVHNAGRSQMASAFFNEMANRAIVTAVSAGTRPAEQVHPVVVTAMKEVGLDLSEVRPQLFSADMAKDAELLVTMGCEEECPVLPGVRREDWQISDPAGQTVERVREIREEIRDRVQKLLTKEGWA